MKLIKKITAVLLTLVLVSSAFVCLAADGGKQYYNYDKVLLLGDSEASGFTDYGDEMSEFTRVDDSYAAYVADDLGAELIPMACPGFRTLELRVMLDDTYRPDDRYLFKKVPRTSEEEIMAKAPAMKQAIKDTDMVIIGIGGNDWGAYLGWIMEDIQNDNKLPEEFKTALKDLLKNAALDEDIITQIIDLADYLNAQDELAVALPEAMKYAFSNLRANWEYIIEYIYENNPDVTLVVVGMFPTYYQTPEGEPENIAQPNALKKLVEDTIIDYGNKHMVDNIEKYGYIYVDTYGTVVETAHPTVAGHRYVADRILAELPDARFQFSADVSIRNANYKAIEYVTINGIMSGTTADTFSPDEALTKADLTKALNNITGTFRVSDSTKAVNKLTVASDVFKSVEKKSIMTFFKSLEFALEIITSGDSKITRAEGAEILYSYTQTF